MPLQSQVHLDQRQLEQADDIADAHLSLLFKTLCEMSPATEGGEMAICLSGRIETYNEDSKLLSLGHICIEYECLLPDTIEKICVMVNAATQLQDALVEFIANFPLYALIVKTMGVDADDIGIALLNARTDFISVQVERRYYTSIIPLQDHAGIKLAEALSKNQCLNACGSQRTEGARHRCWVRTVPVAL